MGRADHPGCEGFRAALLASAESATLDPAFAAHASGCPACRHEFERARRRVAFLRGLPAVPAPRDLDGLVVAALQAGARQDRAIRALRSLPSVPAPTGLFERVHGPRAPAVLDRLVGEDLADPHKALARRYAGGLRRLRAPDDLARRVDGHAPRRRPATFAAAVLAVAALVLVVGVLFLARPDVPSATPDARPVLVVQRVDSLRGLDPLAGQIVSGLTGGVLDAERLTREGS